MSQIEKLLAVGEDVVSEQAVGFDLDGATAVFERAVYEAGVPSFLQRTSRFTRQRRRAEVRTILMRINEWPKNPLPRAVRRKSVLGSVRGFIAANPVSYDQGQ